VQVFKAAAAMAFLLQRLDDCLLPQFVGEDAPRAMIEIRKPLFAAYG
jgi:hypothetical protein